MAVLINLKICDNDKACGGVAVCPTGAIYYDEEWQPCTLEQETYLLTLTLSESSWEEHLLKGEIQVTDKEEPLCTLDVSCYIPLKAGEGS